MARRSERGRTTSPGTRHVPETPTLRQRSPLTYWVLIFLVVSLVAGPLLLVIQQLLQ